MPPGAPRARAVLLHLDARRRTMSRPLPAPPVPHEYESHPVPVNNQPMYLQPYHDTPTYAADDSFARHSSTSFQDEAKAHEQPSAFEESTQHHGNAEEAYYAPAMYDASLSPKHRNGIWSYEDRRAFQRQPWWAKLLRVAAFIFFFGLIVALSVVMLIAIFLRPPNIGLQSLDFPNSASQVEIQDQSFAVNASLTAVIANPNYISARIKNLTAVPYDPSVRSMPLGNCNVPHKTIEARKNTTLTIPCRLSYNVQDDSNLSVIKDVVNRCGLVQGSSKQNLQILFDSHVTIQFLAFNIPISISPTVSTECPVTRKEVKQALGDHADILGQLGLGNLARRDEVPDEPRVPLHERLRALAMRVLRTLTRGPEDFETDPALHDSSL